MLIFRHDYKLLIDFTIFNTIFNMLNQKFLYKELLGEGSFGVVYLVEFDNQETYALKEVKVNAFVIDQALKQIQVMSKLNHEHVVNIIDSKYDGIETLQILMEYCEKGDLQSHLLEEEKKLSVKQILKLAKQITKAFITMNIHGIIHRDLKPANILVTSEEIVKIADFGCATRLQQSFLSKLYNLSYDKGTANYSSPEELMGKPYSSRCDVWAFGCLIYFLYFGKHPFEEITVGQTLAKIREMTDNNVIIIKQEIDIQIHHLLKMCLVFSDTERASWREITLSRVLEPPTDKIQSFLCYLCSLTNIGNWITKQFWKVRKNMKIDSQKNYIFAYFMIKYQYTNMKMAMAILHKQKQYQYLFKEALYPYYHFSREIHKEVVVDFQASQNYFKQSKIRFEKKPVYADIEKKDSKQQNSAFADLHNSIKVCYKILKGVILDLELKMKQNPQGYEIEPVWVVMGQWINFQAEMCFSKKLQFRDFFKQIKANQAYELIKKYIENYQQGFIE